jgi:hypothetical protein
VPATVKIDAYDYTIYGTLDGTLSYLSPDTLNEDIKPNEQPYYRAQVRISGRQTKRTKPVTAPALLNGLWLLLSTLTLLEHYDIDQLKQYAQFVFPNRHGP